MPAYQIPQSSSSRPLTFMLVSSIDHITGLAGASPTVTISKNGGAFAAPAGAVSEVGNGVYKVAGNATDSGTLGPLWLHATATGADPSDTLYEVVAFDGQAGTNLGLSALPAASPGTVGGLPVANSSGYVGADLQTIKSQPVTCSGGVTIPAATLASTTNITAAAGVTLAASQTFSTTGSVGSVTGSVGSVSSATSIATACAAAILVTPANKLATDAAGEVRLDYSQGLPTNVIDQTTGSAFADVATAMTAAEVATACAAAILVTPANKIATSSAGGVQLDLNQAVPTSNTAQTVGDSLNAARAQGFGKWVLSGTTLTLYAADGTTAVRSFTLDNAAAPTQRS
ncbi:hypothetical protein OJF2_72550 [Aquisphaera giovannonii]|uniref:Uncharacterized protein n=1 Tax=Aquisphaera giovannonii TaxID=406548 RepID=A0A5B9WEI2_9BACT|nr:hypothetical protein [Aquisphaera giovannonii]QEH38649.1 hypothetical protein OJF2_72550 [Aquisphaera giovannonii]